VDEKENTLVKTHKAIEFNQLRIPVFENDIPRWLVPKRALGIGETWVQVGVLPKGAADTAPRPQVVRRLNRLVLFEGRRAAEVSSTATSVDLGLKGSYVQSKEGSLFYLDLETGEPLWYESKAEDDQKLDVIFRGCNQIFNKHLLWTPKWNPGN
jgi:hypothetical protein